MFFKFLLLFLGCFISISPALGGEKILIGGGSGPIHNIFGKVKEPFNKATGIELVLKDDGPDRALADLDTGSLEVASAGLNNDQWFKLMDEKNLKLKNNKSDFKFRVIGKDIIRVVANKAVNIKNLDSEQLKNIFSGKTKNWREVGGSNISIRVVVGSKIPGIYKFFGEKILAGASYPDSKIEALDTLDVEKKVAENEGAVGLGPMGAPGDNVAYPKIPEIGRPIMAATKGIPSQNVIKLFNYIQNEGQQYIAK